jgi:hypothetical protein
MVLRVGAHIAAAGSDHHTWRRQRGLHTLCSCNQGEEEEREDVVVHQPSPCRSMMMNAALRCIASCRPEEEARAMTKGYFQWG